MLSVPRSPAHYSGAFPVLTTAEAARILPPRAGRPELAAIARVSPIVNGADDATNALHVARARVRVDELDRVAEERTASLLAGGRDPSLWHCFGCGAGGSVYDFAALLAGYKLPLRGEAFRVVRDGLQRHYADRPARAAA